MIVDTHTHAWNPKAHLAEETVQQLGHIIGKPERMNVNVYDFNNSMANVDRAFVLGLRAKFSGISIPNDYIAEFVKHDRAKFIGMMGLDPHDDDMLRQLELGRTDLGLKGIVLSPDLGAFDPRDQRLKEVYLTASKHHLPIFYHSGQFPISRSALRFASPILLDDVLRSFPDLRIVICHVGRPFIQETIAILRKHPGAHADLASVIDSPWELYNIVTLCQEHNVLSKLLFASDYPFTAPRELFVKLRDSGEVTKGTKLPSLADTVINEVIHRNAFKCLGIELDLLIQK